MAFLGGSGGGMLGNSPIGGISGMLDSGLGIDLSDTPFVGNLLFGNKEAEQSKKAMQRVGKEYAAYRPMQMQNYETLKGNAAAQYAPTLSALQSMYGMQGVPQQQASPPPPGTVPYQAAQVMRMGGIDPSRSKYSNTSGAPVATGGIGGSGYNNQGAIQQIAPQGHYSVAPNGTISYIVTNPGQEGRAAGQGWNGRTDVMEGALKRSPEEERNALKGF